MYPSVRQFMTIADKNLLKNNPVERADIQAAEDIFGTNLGALKVKTAQRKGNPIDGRIHSVPPAIRNKYKAVALSMDIMFIDKVAFLVTTSQGLRFGTVHRC
jgi:hypothetical protein